MIFFYGEGRFGNQLFQYQALNHIADAREWILAFGLEELPRHLLLHGPRLVVLTRNRTLKLFAKYVIVPWVARPLARTLRFFNYAVETVGGAEGNEPSGLMTIRLGLFPIMTFVDGGHYQNASLWQPVFPTPLFDVKPNLREAARRFVTDAAAHDRRVAFVHVRRGDYLNFSQHGLATVVLPLSYYSKAIQELERKLGKVRLVFVTDDAPWVEENFRHIHGKKIASFDAAMDFAIMSECDAGIVSNSTFALAAAYSMRNPELVIIPRYWFGFAKHIWSPPRIYAEHPKVVDVAVND